MPVRRKVVLPVCFVLGAFAVVLLSASSPSRELTSIECDAPPLDIPLKSLDSLETKARMAALHQQAGLALALLQSRITVVSQVGN